MNTSIFLAQAFAIYLLIMGVALLFCREYFFQAAIEIAESKGQSLILSIFTLILGILLVLFHNVWVANWQVVITLLAWVTLLKGIIRLLLPTLVLKWMKAFDNNTYYYSVVVFSIALGLYLIYMGFAR